MESIIIKNTENNVNTENNEYLKDVINVEDIFTFQPLNEISKDYLIKYTLTDDIKNTKKKFKINSQFVFDIRSFVKYIISKDSKFDITLTGLLSDINNKIISSENIDSKVIELFENYEFNINNPFTNVVLPKQFLFEICKKYVNSYIKNPEDFITIKETIHDLTEKKAELKLIDAILLIDQLGLIFVQPRYLLGLSTSELAIFYFECYTLWNESTIQIETKKEINEDVGAFRSGSLGKEAILKFSRKQLYIAFEQQIRKFCTFSPDKNTRILGALFFISALATYSRIGKEELDPFWNQNM